MNMTNTSTLTNTYHIPTIQADPFIDNDQFIVEHAEHKNAIQELVDGYTAILFQAGNKMLAFHPSAKQAGQFQVTLFINNIPVSDSQHDTKHDAAKRISEYSNIQVLEVVA